MWATLQIAPTPMRVDVCMQFTTKNLKIKIVRERYVFVGPLPSALPPPLQGISILPVGFSCVGHCGSWLLRAALCPRGHAALCFVGHCGSWFLHGLRGKVTNFLPSVCCQFGVSLWVIVHDSQLVVVYFMRSNHPQLNIT